MNQAAKKAALAEVTKLDQEDCLHALAIYELVAETVAPMRAVLKARRADLYAYMRDFITRGKTLQATYLHVITGQLVCCENPYDRFARAHAVFIIPASHDWIKMKQLIENLSTTDPGLYSNYKTPLEKLTTYMEQLPFEKIQNMPRDELDALIAMSRTPERIV